MPRKKTTEEKDGGQAAPITNPADALREFKRLGADVDEEGGMVVEAALKTKRSAAAVPLLQHFSGLRRLRLAELPLAGDELAVLEHLQNLEELMIFRCGRLSDRGLRAIGCLSRLRSPAC